MGMSQRGFGSFIHQVAAALCRHAATYIKFPTGEEAIQRQKIKFYQLKQMPNVISLCDGSHVFILTPAKDIEHLYVSRKGGHSINVQFVCDADGKFTNVVAQWPGSTHDSFIWINCGLRRQFLQNPPDGIMLGEKSKFITVTSTKNYNEVILN